METHEPMNETQATHLIWHTTRVSRERRQARNGHRGVVVWFTGLSGSGKSTLACALERRLFDQGCRTIVLDGDNVRHGLCGDLTFSESDRKENIRRIGEVAKLLAETGLIVLTAFISPFRQDRKWVRDLMRPGDFIEVYCKASLATCEARDVKGLYKKARAGEIRNYTGIDSPYEPPEHPDLVINTQAQSPQEATQNLYRFLLDVGQVMNPTDA